MGGINKKSYYIYYFKLLLYIILLLLEKCEIKIINNKKEIYIIIISLARWFTGCMQDFGRVRSSEFEPRWRQKAFSSNYECLRGMRGAGSGGTCSGTRVGKGGARVTRALPEHFI